MVYNFIKTKYRGKVKKFEENSNDGIWTAKTSYERSINSEWDKQGSYEYSHAQAYEDNWPNKNEIQETKGRIYRIRKFRKFFVLKLIVII